MKKIIKRLISIFLGFLLGVYLCTKFVLPIASTIDEPGIVQQGPYKEGDLTITTFKYESPVMNTLAIRWQKESGIYISHIPERNLYALNVVEKGIQVFLGKFSEGRLNEYMLKSDAKSIIIAESTDDPGIWGDVSYCGWSDPPAEKKTHGQCYCDFNFDGQFDAMYLFSNGKVISSSAYINKEWVTADKVSKKKKTAICKRKGKEVKYTFINSKGWLEVEHK